MPRQSNIKSKRAPRVRSSEDMELVFAMQLLVKKIVDFVDNGDVDYEVRRGAISVILEGLQDAKARDIDTEAFVRLLFMAKDRFTQVQEATWSPSRVRLFNSVPIQDHPLTIGYCINKILLKHWGPSPNIRHRRQRARLHAWVILAKRRLRQSKGKDYKPIRRKIGWMTHDDIQRNWKPALQGCILWMTDAMNRDFSAEWEAFMGRDETYAQ